MPKLINLAGKSFGRLAVIYRVPPFKWYCKCECGNAKVIHGQSLRTGVTTSCGCLQKEKASHANTTHGMTGSIEHRCWRHIKGRCYNKNDSRYMNYGGRGISVCDRWLSSFEHFYADMGERPSDKTSIERINNDLGYSPDNCKWATSYEQSNNTSRSVVMEYNGERLNRTQMAKKYGIAHSTFRMRLSLGWSIHDALTRPVRS